MPKTKISKISKKETKESKEEKEGKTGKDKAFAKEMFQNISYNFLSSFADRLGGLIFAIILARMLLPELFGVYSLTLSVILLLLTVADIGLGQTLIRYVSYSLGKGKKDHARSYLFFIWKIRFVSIILFSLALLLFSDIIAIYIFKKPEIILSLRFGAVYLIFSSFLDITSFIFFAIKKVKLDAIRQGIFQVARIAIAPVLILLLSSEYKVPGVFIALTLSAIIAFFFSFVSIKKHYGFLLKGKKIVIDKLRVLKFTFFLTIISFSALAFTYIDSLMLGRFLPVEYVGYYRIAFMIMSSAASFAFFVNVLLPIFTQLEGEKFREAFRKTFYFTSIFAFPIAFGLAFIAAPFIKVLFGEAYLPASFPLYALSFLVLDVSLFSYFALAFQAKEKPQLPMYGTIVAAIVNVILNYIFITQLSKISFDYGMLGAALATLITRLGLAVFLGVAAHKKFGLQIQAESIYKPFIASLVMVLSLLLMPSPTTLLLGIIEILAAAFVYFLILFLIRGIKKEDILYVKSLIKG